MAVERERQPNVCVHSTSERIKLLHAHYAGAVSLDLLKREQERITSEMAAPENQLRSASRGIEKAEAVVAKAVAWADRCYDAYLRSDPNERRLLNQAFFKRVLSPKKVSSAGSTGSCLVCCWLHTNASASP